MDNTTRQRGAANNHEHPEAYKQQKNNRTQKKETELQAQLKTQELKEMLKRLK